MPLARPKLDPERLLDDLDADQEVAVRATSGPVAIHAEVWVSLNQRPWQQIVDPTVDLASQPRNLFPKRWILPLAQSTPGQAAANPARPYIDVEFYQGERNAPAKEL